MNDAASPRDGAAAAPIDYGPEWRRWTLFAIVALCFIACQFQRSTMAVLSPILIAEMNATAEQLGAITSAFFWGVALMQIPCGILFDRYGARLVMGITLFVGVAGGFCFAFGESIFMLGVGQALVGLGTASVFMGSAVLVGRWWSPASFATMVALIMSLGYVGNLLATLPFQKLIDWTGGWRWPFAGIVFAQLLCTLAILLVVRDAPAGSAFANRKPEPLAKVAAGLREVFAHPAMVGLCGAAFISYSVNFAVRGIWAGPYLQTVHGLDGDQRGLVLLLMSALGTLGIFMAGYIAGKQRNPRLVVIGFAGTGAMCLAALALSPGLSTPWVLGLLLTFGLISNFFPAVLEHGRTLFDDRLRGRSMTSINVWVFVGVGITQLAIGQVIEAWPRSASGAYPEAAYLQMYAYLAGFAALGITVYAVFARYVRKVV